MTVKLGKLIAAQESLKKLFASEDFPVSFKWHLMKFKKAVEAELQEYEEQRIELVKKYGTNDGKDNIVVGQDRMAEFIPKMMELHEVEVDIHVSKIRLENLEGAKLSADDMLHLEPFVAE
jgi:hypothetical protein